MITIQSTHFLLATLVCLRFLLLFAPGVYLRGRKPAIPYCPMEDVSEAEINWLGYKKE
jgi:hypothetical protein